MSQKKQKMNLSLNRAIPIVLVCLLLAISAYLAIFGRALKQGENDGRLLLALPQAIFSSQAVSIGKNLYLAKDGDAFINTMESQGFEFVEQAGAGYFFRKDGQPYISTSRQYSSRFRIFTNPMPSRINY